MQHVAMVCTPGLSLKKVQDVQVMTAHLKPGQDAEVLLHISPQDLVNGCCAQGHPILLWYILHPRQANASEHQCSLTYGREAMLRQKNAVAAGIMQHNMTAAA